MTVFTVVGGQVLLSRDYQVIDSSPGKTNFEGLYVACVASVSVGLSVHSRSFSLFGCAKIGRAQH